MDLPPGGNIFFPIFRRGLISGISESKKLNDFMDATDWHPGWEVDPTWVGGRSNIHLLTSNSLQWLPRAAC